MQTHYFLPPKQRVPTSPVEWPIPTLRLRVDDLEHPGAQIFFNHIQPYDALRTAIMSVYTWLYTLETVPREVEVINLVLRSMPGGVAHTTGTSIYKEIHFSLEHIQNCADRAEKEIMGVLTHEVVHCFQFNGNGKAPGGLIEGVAGSSQSNRPHLSLTSKLILLSTADWVRLHAGLAPPHWKARPGDRWDAGYDSTAYFLDWMEGKYGTANGLVRTINLTLRDREYEDVIFKEHTGKKVSKLWKLYCDYLQENNK
ncbi:plant basic secretory protein [Panus rudis PR-1116 ss-1]|nr:plant basic secretory protein [Panus rudis PR-1116 ss-1]